MCQLCVRIANGLHGGGTSQGGEPRGGKSWQPCWELLGACGLPAPAGHRAPGLPLSKAPWGICGPQGTSVGWGRMWGCGEHLWDGTGSCREHRAVRLRGPSMGWAKRSIRGSGQGPRGASFSRRGPLRGRGPCGGRCVTGRAPWGRRVTGPGTSPHRLPQQRGPAPLRGNPPPRDAGPGCAAAPGSGSSTGTLRTVPSRAVPCRAEPCCAVPCRAVPCRAVPSRAEPPRVGGLCRAIRRPHRGQRRGAMCAPGLLSHLLLLLLLLPLPLAALPGAAPSTGAGPPARTRARRGLTYPGTLWCGAGSNADAYEQLGEHRDTDRCCRDHDHCQHVIHPFTARYGYRNLRWHTISHCDCDRRLKECLRQVNDTASRVVGQAFFNVIQVPCFEFAYKEECVEPYLYVWCRAYNTVAIAVPREPVLYEFGGELIDRAARPAGVPLSPPWSSVGGGAIPAEHHVPTHPPSSRKAAKKERKGKKKDKKKKGKGQVPQAPLPRLGEAANAILSDAPAWEDLGRGPVLATPSPVSTASGKRRRKERNRKKRLKSKAEGQPAREAWP
uniref:phospholipase A2 n=4 Tax=Neoaves TaxID=3078114 RepID=A0A8C4ULZ6_FALTI